MELPDYDAERTRVFVPHYALTLDDLPAPGASWEETIAFAGAFDGITVLPDNEHKQQFLTASRERFAADGTLPEGLTSLRAALFVEQRADHWAGEDGDGPDMRYVHALVEEIRRRIGASEHDSPPATPGGVRDRVMNAYDRLLEGYAAWGGWRYYGWGDYEDPSTYMGPAIWSERDCDLKLAQELEREFPGAVHMEFRSPGGPAMTSPPPRPGSGST